jgi:hypothetical protein
METCNRLNLSYSAWLTGQVDMASRKITEPLNALTQIFSIEVVPR